MAEFGYNNVQTIQYDSQAELSTIIPCNKGYVIHREGSGIITLRGIVNNPSACFARYLIEFSANIALSAGETVGPISVTIIIDGEPIGTSTAIVTPAAVGDYFNVSCNAIISVPRGCCYNISIENNSTGQVTIDMQNANMIVSRIA